MKTFLAKVLGISSSVWNFYAPLLKALFISGASALLPIALEVVGNLAQTDKSGSEKREEAVGILKQAAVRHGISVTESIIRFTVESAVQRMRV
jgi:hypothetical protein